MLTMAALDALVVDSVVEAVPALAQKGELGPKVGKWIRENADGVLACFAETEPSQALAEIVRGELGSQTFQRASAIEGVLRDVLGVEGLWESAAKRLSTKDRTWSAEEVRNQLDVYVARRNRIAHDGDMQAGRRSATEPIQRRFVVSAIEVTRAVGESVVSSVSDRVKGRPG